MHPRKLRGRGRPSAPPTSALPLLDQLYPNSSVAASDTESHPPGVQSPNPTAQSGRLKQLNSRAPPRPTVRPLRPCLIAPPSPSFEVLVHATFCLSPLGNKTQQS